jgi:hypothetical protein
MVLRVKRRRDSEFPKVKFVAADAEIFNAEAAPSSVEQSSRKC